MPPSTTTKSGHKQTEVGVIPQDWRVSRLGELCVFENGDRGKNYPSPASFARSGVPFVNAGHIADGHINSSELNYITRESYDRLGGGKFKPGDILFCLRGSLGKFGIVGPDFGEGAIASSLVIVRPNSASVSREYLGCYFNSELCVQMIGRWSGGAAQPNLGAQDLARFAIPLPPGCAEQHAILHALTDVHDLINTLDKLIAKRRDLKQAAMQQLLTGKKRLGGFRSKWKHKKLVQIAPLQRGFDLPATAIMPGIFPVVYSNGVLNFHSEYMVKGPGVVTGRSGTIGKVNYIEQDHWPHNTALWVTSFKHNDPKFIFYLYSFIGFERFGTGSGVPTLNRNDVHAFEVEFPTDPEEQTAIATVLSDIDTNISALENRRDKTHALKQGMMQELLTGKTRLT